MNHDDLKELIQASSQAVERQLDCHGDYALASYLEGGLSEDGHRQLEKHLADCHFCLERIGLISRAGSIETETHVPELLLARAAKLANDQQPIKSGNRLRRARQWAAAAVVALVVGMLINLDSPSLVEPGTAPPGSSSSEIRQARNMDPYALVPRVLSPLENSTIEPLSQEFSWAPVRGSLYYHIRIVSDEGDLVWQERVKGTQWGLPADLSLQSGTEYFVRVDAYLAESKSLSSDYVVFRVKDKS